MPTLRVGPSPLTPTIHSIRVRAFAKINLGLKVLGKRPDGYHEILTIYQTVALHDRLEILLRRASGGGTRRAREDVRVVCDDAAVPSGPRNLVHQACRLWKRARKFRGAIEVRLQKRIPVGGGLGGGSSDAAATVLGLERLTGDRLDAPSRFKLAARLGSDVPLFLCGGRVLGCGRGEKVYPLQDLPRRNCLVVFPGFSVSTTEAYQTVVALYERGTGIGDRGSGSAEAYQAVAALYERRRRSQTAATTTDRSLRLTRVTKAPRIYDFGARPQFSLKDWGPAENDFERVAFARWPELAKLKRRFIRAGAETASLTGSGSAVYAIFASARQLDRASRLVPAGWQVFRTRALTRAEYRRLLFERLPVTEAMNDG
ncbi:MAG: 4-(cytidine 5'-diphospho)-2-C-methyl-D-erythritol kinase [Acidobacteria bacterium]|nr:MAG: 4-(cytidine 5'-diphospho)-2-C-methyl-D-erythritol kinase [Acidobacteriota bacterium]